MHQIIVTMSTTTRTDVASPESRLSITYLHTYLHAVLFHTAGAKCFYDTCDSLDSKLMSRPTEQPENGVRIYINLNHSNKYLM